MEHKIPFKTSTNTRGEYGGEGSSTPIGGQPFIPPKGCQCIAPRIYVGGKILDECQRCGLPVNRARRGWR